MIEYRPLLDHPEAWERIRQIRNADDVRAWMYQPHIISQAEHLAWIERLRTDASQIIKVIFDDGVPVGQVNLQRIDREHKTCAWGYYLDASVRGRGIGLSTARYALKWAFEIGMEKVGADVLAFNDKAWSVDTKAGMTEEGRIRSAYLRDGKRIDVVLLGITRAEWEILQHGVDLTEVCRLAPDPVLYELLCERGKDEAISYKPTSEDAHMDFVRSHPYRAWYVIEKGGKSIGAISVNDRNEIRVGLLSAFKDPETIKAAIAELTRMVPELEPAPSVRIGWAVNVNPMNAEMRSTLEQMGARLIQHTYAL